ncbi:MAG: hypothetical protein AAGJ51_09285, partial [Pseudomonadota bacterium]
LEPFLRLWMGTAWLDQIWIAYIATGFQFIWQSNAFIGQVYTGLGFTKKPGIVAIITGMINLLISVFLVQAIGVAGVILGTVIAGLCGVALFVLWCLPDIGITPQIYLKNVLLQGQGPIWGAWLVLLLVQNMSGMSATNWGVLLAYAALFFMTLFMVAFYMVMQKDERALALKLVKRRF